MPPIPNFGRGYDLYYQNYHSLHHLAWTTVYDKWPGYLDDMIRNNPNTNDYIPEEIVHLLEDFPQHFQYDDRKHLLYKWVTTPRLLELIRGMEYENVVDGEYVEREKAAYNTPEEIAKMEELKAAIENGEITCVYKY
jgi:hypothetical protein